MDWRLEFAIWNYTFSGYDSPITVDPTDTSLILTEAPMSLQAISANTDQMIFEEYGFESYYRCTPGSLVPWNDFETDLFQLSPKPIHKQHRQKPSKPATPTATSIQTPNNNNNNNSDDGGENDGNNTTKTNENENEDTDKQTSEIDVNSTTRTTTPNTNTNETPSASPPPDKQHPLAECAIVVDIGFNCTSIMPTILGEVYWPAVQQISVGGRMLTNYLRETLSFRHYNMMEETFLVNSIKESVSFVSQDFFQDLKICKEFKRNQQIRRKTDDDDDDNDDGGDNDNNNQNKDASTDKRIPPHQRKSAKDPPFTVKYVLPENPSEIGYVLSSSDSSSAASSSSSSSSIPSSSGSGELSGGARAVSSSLPGFPITGNPTTTSSSSTSSGSRPGSNSSLEPTNYDGEESRRQILKLSTERFSVPELLFSPHHVGLNQAGLSESIMNSVSRSPQELQSLLLANVVLVGGCANIPGIAERVYTDLQSQVPSYSSLSIVPSLGNGGVGGIGGIGGVGGVGGPGDRGSHQYPNRGILRVVRPKDSPETYPWRGGVRLGLQPEMLAKVHVTRQDYMEYGERLCASKFNARRMDDSSGNNDEDGSPGGSSESGENGINGINSQRHNGSSGGGVLFRNQYGENDDDDDDMDDEDDDDL